MSPSVNSPAPTASRDGRDDVTQNSQNSQNSQNGESEYPEQLHAGAVGLGPEYGRGVARKQTTGDKLSGYKDELKGKVLRKPDVAQHGHDLRTGELKRREQAQDDDGVRPSPLRPTRAFAYTHAPIAGSGAGPPEEQQQPADCAAAQRRGHRAPDGARAVRAGIERRARGRATSTPGEHAYKNIG
ncbi:uncharacterized protein B0H18DRAFT_1075866 [Fomitopsis serialis]|uniref:uncharacterized protein n=1 Tax=Fomitopsis serialis TaxID=139415 RepID=UPI002008193D|nr:uncharacterized protein B0H18DRAFT_1075866 [Neoantrodia serialis]KAH9908242.1 hypothetical protein B0H18DRAFT_1075866 [Neoantrodia serialis]